MSHAADGMLASRRGDQVNPELWVNLPGCAISLRAYELSQEVREVPTYYAAARLHSAMTSAAPRRSGLSAANRASVADSGNGE